MQPSSPRAHAAPTNRRLVVWTTLLAIITALVYLMATAKTGPVDPTEVNHPQSHTTVVFNSATIVFREGLEAVLIFAALTASLKGAQLGKRKPMVAGVAIAFVASVATWFVVQALLEAASPLGAKLEAITGFIAIAVLLVVLNWFVHKVYWSEWIGRHHRQRRRLLAQTGFAATAGLVLLGFTSVYREGFETVLFLQNLQLKSGSGTVLEGVGIGLAATSAVGFLTFWLHTKLPYKKMLILTGGLVAMVLVVMTGGTALSFQDLGWLPAHPTPFTVPGWMGSWFEMYSTWETLGARLEAITGFLAIVVLLIVMNWFVHKVYWSEWIGRHHRRRRQLLASTGIGATIGLVALGFTSVYREGFEVVLFLQSLRLEAGMSTVLEGVAFGLAATAAVGVLTFWLHHRLPYKRMLVLTGAMVGLVLVVMIGGTAATFQQLGWLPTHELPFTVPTWLGSWFEIYGTWETVGAQILAAAFVVGSYVLAEQMKVRRPLKRGERPAQRAVAAPAEAPAPMGPSPASI